VIDVIAEQAGAAINHAELHKRVKEFFRSREKVGELFRSAMSGADMSTLYDQALAIVSDILSVRFAKIIEHAADPEKPVLVRAVLGFDADLVDKKFTVSDEPHSVFTFNAREPVKVEDIYQEARFKPSPLHFKYGFISGLSAVIFNGNDVYGIIEVDSAERRNFTEDEVSFLQSVANVLGVIAKCKEMDEVIRQTEERFRILVENIQDYAIYLIDVHGNITSWNSGAERIFGYRGSEILGRRFSVFLTADDLEQGLPQQELEVLVREGHFEVEGWRVRKDGSQFWANVVVNVIYNTEGELIGFSNITRDMTIRKQTEQALQQSNRDLALFATMASHDLKAPLRKIQFFSEHLYESFRDRVDEEALEDLQCIRKSVRHMQALVDDFLSLAGISKESALQLQLVDLFKMAHKVVADFAEQIREKQARVEISPLPAIPGEPAQLEQLLQNLIGNSLKFQKKGIAPEVVVSAQLKDEEYYELRIRDNGIGFPPEHADRIFEPLERLHGKGEYEGTGVGLAICKRIAERHGGMIHAESIPGEGAAFIVRLPVRHFGLGY
jgi:PAS domain S-box-containing protein